MNSQERNRIVINAQHYARREQLEQRRAAQKSKRLSSAARAGAAAAVLTVAAVGVAMKGPEIKRGINDIHQNIELSFPTDEQKKVREILTSKDQEGVVSGLVVDSQTFDHEEFANARNRPSTQIDNGEVNGGSVIGTIKNGSRIKEAVVVDGNNPRTPFEKDEKSPWVAFLAKNGQIEFVWSGELDGPSQIKVWQKTPIDISK